MAKNKNKIALIIVCYVLVFIFSGCNLRDKYVAYEKKVIGNSLDKEVNDKLTDIKALTPIPSVAITPTTLPPTVKPTISIVNEETDIVKEVAYVEGNIDIKEFISFEQAFIDCDFIITKDETNRETESFIIEGKYDLNNDNKEDNVKLWLNNSWDKKSYININDIKLEFYIDNYFNKEVRIIDLDEKDNYLEIACFDDGPSGDPIYIFFRFDGENIYELGSLDQSGLTDNSGRLISGFHTSNQFTPTFVSACYEIENNTFVMKINDINKYLGLSYHFVGGEGFFIPFEEIPERIDILWDNSKHFEPEEVKIIDILNLDSYNRTLNDYFVEFSSGEKGLLYFWIGD